MDEALFLEGVSLQGTQRFNEAIESFKKAYETFEEHLSGVWELGDDLLCGGANFGDSHFQLCSFAGKGEPQSGSQDSLRTMCCFIQIQSW